MRLHRGLQRGPDHHPERGLSQAATPIRVSFEDNTLFGFQTRTMIGLRADYERSKDFTVGATYLQLFERPQTFKVNIGDDPINNRVYGLDFTFNKEAPWLSRAVDKIPFIETKAKSSVQVAARCLSPNPGTPGPSMKK